VPRAAVLGLDGVRHDRIGDTNQRHGQAELVDPPGLGILERVGELDELVDVVRIGRRE
jgi:hypothetical protein